MNALPKLIIFDLDGTLIEFHHDYLFSQTHRVLEKLNRPLVSPTVLEEFFSAFDYFGFVDELERETFIGSFWEHFDWDGFPAPKPILGVIDTLQAICESGIKLAITTSRFMPVPVLREELTPTGILDFMQYVTARSGDHIHWTDKTTLILEACQALDVAPEDAMMVGDIPTDITSAKEVGVSHTVAVTSGGIQESVLAREKPTKILPDVSHLRLLTK